MATIEHRAFLNDGQFDEDGFKRNPRLWSEDLAALIAEVDGFGVLTSEHWRIIYYLREQFLKYHTIPVMQHVCWVTHLDPHCVPDLFGHDSRETSRIAGLPNPGEQAKPRM